VTDGLTAPPQYFPINAKINKEGYNSLDEVLVNGLKALSTDELKKILNQEDVILLDTRISSEFTEGFIPGSISIGLDGRFAEWAGSLLPFDKPIILITEEGKEKESAVRLARVGFDKMSGYLNGGFEAWKKEGNPIDLIINVEADELAMDLPFDENILVIDVRRETEFADGHVRQAMNIPVSEFNDPANMAVIDDHHNVYVHCAGGYRSVIAVSLFKRQGIHNLRNVIGGWDSIKAQDKIETVKENSVLN
jgi:hydroxyacylglutathione hydrolase